ncbi:MAG: virginiamycin B lyase [Ktedonobacterales bacterium]
MSTSGALQEFPLPDPTSFIGCIAVGRDGNIWYTNSSDEAIGRLTPTGAVQEFDVSGPTGNGEPLGIAAGPDGNLWFTVYSSGEIGRITPTGDVQVFSVPGALAGTGENAPLLADLISITDGPDGDLWFTEAGITQPTNGTGQTQPPSTSAIGRISPTGIIQLFPLPDPSSVPGDITSGPDGNLWFTAEDVKGGMIGRISPTGAINEFRLPDPNSIPVDITTGPDGNLWFTEGNESPNTLKLSGGTLGRISPSGAVQIFPLPDPASNPIGITAGPDGNVWFTESATDTIGRLVPWLADRGIGAGDGSPVGSIVRVLPQYVQK